MNKQVKIKCEKCNGTGHIGLYRHIQGGVCFSCNGSGYKVQSANKKTSKLYTISAIDIEENKRDIVFHIKARSETEAQKKAIKQLARGNGYYSETAQVES